MIFNTIHNVPAFFKCISSCIGDVSFIDEHGCARDLKELAMNSELLGGMLQTATLRPIEVQASDLRDRQKLIRFMHEMRAC